jgi:hypothetical protein
MQENTMKKLMTLAVAGALSSFGMTASAAPCFLFGSQIQFSAMGPFSAYQNTSFQPIILRSVGARTHAFELLFQYPGDPNAFGTPAGAIELMTNSMFARNEGMRLAQFDMGSIQANADGSFSFTLDPGAALQLPPPNMFTVPGMAGSPGGLGGICNLPGLSGLCQQTQQAPVLQLYYLVASEGTVTFSFPGGNSIAGEMFIAGYGLDNSNIRATYYARFSGPLQAQGEC